MVFRRRRDKKQQHTHTAHTDRGRFGAVGKDVRSCGIISGARKPLLPCDNFVLRVVIVVVAVVHKVNGLHAMLQPQREQTRIKSIVYDSQTIVLNVGVERR